MGQHRHVRVAVIGSGFAGIGAAVRLRREGVTDFVLLERADSVGGTWRDNDYPGCACDVPSHLYSFSFAPNPDWPRAFSGQRYIREYLEKVVDTFGIRPHLRLGHEVTTARWDAERLHWVVSTAPGTTYTADVVVSAGGPLSDPRTPDIPGLDGFPGHVFHTARWDHDVDLRGKRVAVVGTGASAIQVVPAIQPSVGRLTLFQRTPPWVLPRRDRGITALERALHRAVPATVALRRRSLWRVRELQVQAFTRHPGELGLVEAMARRHMAKAIADPDLRARLTPSYRIGCKRILLSNAYYPALTRPNVDVVTSGLAEVRGSELVAQDGTTAEADAIVFATGFHVTDMPIARRVVGVGGRTLAEAWSEGGMRSLRGATVDGFPNWMTLIGPNTGLGNSSMILMIEAQLNYLADYLCKLDSLDRRGRGRRAALDARPGAVHAWNEQLQVRMARTVWSTGGCTSWYMDAEGRNTTVWPGTTAEFRRQTLRVDPAEYDIVRQREPGAAANASAGPAEEGNASAGPAEEGDASAGSVEEGNAAAGSTAKGAAR